MDDARTPAEIERDAIVRERAGVLTLGRKLCAQVVPMIAAGRLPGADADALKDRIMCFADAVAQGLHREEADPEGVRAAMREIVTGRSGETAHG